MSRRKQLVEKIIREELVGYMKKFLGEGMRTPVQTMPAKKPDRARNPRQMASSTMTSIVDPPDLEHHFVEEEISGQLAEEADEADSENYGVDTTAPITPGEDHRLLDYLPDQYTPGPEDEAYDHALKDMLKSAEAQVVHQREEARVADLTLALGR